MTASSVTIPVAHPTVAARTPSGLWLAAACYALIALGPIPLHYYWRAQLPDEPWAGTTPFDAYLGVGLLYFGGSAACSVMLLKRRRTAVGLAAFLVAWRVLEQVAQLRLQLQGRLERESVLVALGAVVPVVMGLLALYVCRLRRQGVLP